MTVYKLIDADGVCIDNTRALSYDDAYNYFADSWNMNGTSIEEDEQ